MKLVNLATLLVAANLGGAQIFSIQDFQNRLETKEDNPTPKGPSSYYRQQIARNDESPVLIEEALATLEKAHLSGNHGDVFYYYNLALNGGDAGKIQIQSANGLDYRKLSFQIDQIIQVYGSKYLELLRDTTTVPFLSEFLKLYIKGDFPWKGAVYYPGKTSVSIKSSTRAHTVTGIESQYTKPNKGALFERSNYYQDLHIWSLADNKFIEQAIANLERANHAKNHGDVFYYYNLALSGGNDTQFEEIFRDKLNWNLVRISQDYGTDYLELIRDTATVPYVSELVTKFIDGNFPWKEDVYYPGDKLVVQETEQEPLLSTPEIGGYLKKFISFFWQIAVIDI